MDRKRLEEILRHPDLAEGDIQEIIEAFSAPLPAVIYCQACKGVKREGGCYTCGGYGTVLHQTSCKTCGTTYWAREGCWTVSDGKTFVSVDGLTMVYRYKPNGDFVCRCQACDDKEGGVAK